jgi:hypothetical protein
VSEQMPVSKQGRDRREKALLQELSECSDCGDRRGQSLRRGWSRNNFGEVNRHQVLEGLTGCVLQTRAHS